MRFPPHKGELTLTHNANTVNYVTVREEIESDPQMYGSDDEWVAEGERERAIRNNDLWTLHWYPETPIGFCVMHAASFKALSDWMAARPDATPA